jgi:hypothetical protein
MVWNWDLMSMINLALSLVILMLGCWDYIKTKRQAPFFIGVAFGLFSVSHLITLMGVERNFETTVILVRIFAYLIVAATLVKMAKEK